MTRFRLNIIICVFLVVVSLAVFWQVGNHDFVNYDDDVYLTQNPYVRNGWAVDGIQWAFTSRLHGHWHPVTWLSHMTDCQLFGLRPGWHHRVNLLFHLFNALLLFMILRLMTGAVYRSAFVAALFALHPLHVESVAWVSSRKDILSAFFMFLAMLTYNRYAKNKNISPYILTALLYILGLMSKSMIITLPGILLLMDVWPLQRIHMDNSRPVKDKIKESLPLIYEKIPLFILAGIFVILTISVLRSVEFTHRPISKYWAIDFPVYYVTYIWKMIWPVHLSVLYPYSPELPIWKHIVSGIFLIAVTGICLKWARTKPYLVVGWMWFLITLLPVIGLLKTGPHGISDRYTYIPLIGIFIMVSWGIPDLLAKWRYRNVVLSAAGAVMIVTMMTVSAMQVRYWKNSLTLFEHAVKTSPDSYEAYYNLGTTFLGQGEIDKAIAHFNETLKIVPDYTDAYNNMGNAFMKRGDFKMALKNYNEAIRIEPDNPEFHNNAGVALEMSGDIPGAIRHYQEALRIAPGLGKAYNNMGNALKLQGELDTSEQYFKEAIEKEPWNARFHNDLGVVLDSRGKLDEAIGQYKEALRLAPDYAKAHYNLGNVYRRQRRLDQAIHHLSEAVRIEPKNAEYHNNLGVAVAQTGHLTKAFGHFSDALKIKPDYTKARQNLELVIKILEGASTAKKNNSSE